MLQAQIPLGETKAASTLVEPGLPVIAALLPAPAGENAGRAFFRVAKIFAQNTGRIREVNDVIAKEKIALDNVPNEPAKKRDVAASADRHPDIGQRTRARKARIDVDNRGATLLCLHHPAKTYR